jgi:hypothetical protein
VGTFYSRRLLTRHGLASRKPQRNVHRFGLGVDAVTVMMRRTYNSVISMFVRMRTIHQVYT